MKKYLLTLFLMIIYGVSNANTYRYTINIADDVGDAVAITDIPDFDYGDCKFEEFETHKLIVACSWNQKSKFPIVVNILGKPRNIIVTVSNPIVGESKVELDSYDLFHRDGHALTCDKDGLCDGYNKVWSSAFTPVINSSPNDPPASKGEDWLAKPLYITLH